MAKLYYVFKWRLHKHYLACGTPRECRANPPPFDLWNGRPKQHWHWLCDKVYTAEDFLELSKTNVKNRKQLKFHHKGGAMPFIQHAKKAAKNGGHLSVIDNWESLHKDENQQWVHDVAPEKHGVMKQIQDERREKLIVEAPEDIPHDSVHVPLRDELEIMSETLERKGKCIRGVGSFPRIETIISSSAVSKSELTEIQEQLKLLETNFTEMKKVNEQLKALVRALLASKGKTSNTSSDASSGQYKNRLPADNDYDEFGDYDD